MKRKAVSPPSEELASSGSSSFSSPPLSSWSSSSSSFSSPPAPSWLSSDNDEATSKHSVSRVRRNAEEDPLGEEVRMGAASPDKHVPTIVILSSSESENEGSQKVEMEVEEEKSFSGLGSVNHYGADNEEDEEENEDSVNSGSVETSAKCAPAEHNEVSDDDAEEDEEEKEEEEQEQEDDDDNDEEENDYSVSSGSVRDSETIKTSAKCTPGKHTEVAEEEEENEEEEEEEEQEDDDDNDEEENEDSVTSGSANDSETIETSAKCAPAKHTEVVVDDDEEEEEEEEDVDEEGATEIQQVLLNSIMEDDIDEHTGENPLGNEESSENDSGEEMKIKDPQEEEIEECYKLMDFCLDSSNHFGAETGQADEDSEKNPKQLCKEGKHYMILNEEIGIYCTVCDYIEEEIRHMMPAFHSNPFAVSGKSDYYGNRGPNNVSHFEDSNIEYQHFKDGDQFDTTGTVWEIMPSLRDTLLAHQREAFEFIWKNVAGGTNLSELVKKKTSEGGGCLISHSPGTGKTRLAISFLETYMKFSKKSRPLVLAPASILLTWKQEFEKWKVEVPFLNLNEDELTETEMSLAGSLFGSRNLNRKNKRLFKLWYWKKHDSVLAISYSLFTKLERDEKFRELLIETPGILVLDEAHVARNETSLIFKALKKVRPKKRILLSGTPFQNNFRELRNTLCLMRKEFNDEIEQFKKSGVDESDEGKIRDLKEKMKPFFHSCGSDVLFARLPGLVKYDVSLQPTELQKRLLAYEEKQPKCNLDKDVNMALISIHPMLLHCKESKTDLAQELKGGSWDISDGSKFRFLITFIQLSSSLQEKVLVFSQYLPPLNLVKAVLQSDRFGWKEGAEFHLMDGSQTMKKRKKMMDEFNNPKGKAKVMLASTKACSEGIKFTGASRVILLDVTWNPSVEDQAIGRAFRMGQQRVVHVYRLIVTSNDSNRHLIQTQKSGFSKYMFPDKKGDDCPQSSMQVYEDVILDRLREENIIQDAILVQKRINHF